jgi:hypothetical protein
MDNLRKYLNEPMPCDGCTHNVRCAKEKLACVAFALYVHRGDDNWTVPRLPTERTYAGIMFSKDNSFINEVYKQLRTQEILL